MSGFLVEGRRFRWRGDASALEQPDAGDVLRIVDPAPRDGEPERYLLVLGSLQVRGKAEHHLWLWVTRTETGADGSIPDDLCAAVDGGGRIFPCALDRCRRRR